MKYGAKSWNNPAGARALSEAPAWPLRAQVDCVNFQPRRPDWARPESAESVRRRSRPAGDSSSCAIEDVRQFFEDWLTTLGPPSVPKRRSPPSFEERFSVERSWVLSGGAPRERSSQTLVGARNDALADVPHVILREHGGASAEVSWNRTFGFVVSGHDEIELEGRMARLRSQLTAIPCAGASW